MLKGVSMGLLRRLAGTTSGKVAMAAALALSLGGCLGYDGDVQHGYVIDEAALGQVKPGSSAEQVLVVLGTPSTTSTVGGDAWYYISQHTARAFAFQKPNIDQQRILAVYFTKDKKVDRVANYGLQDGKIIDFITRETPTGGTEENFLQNAFKNLLRF
jgi:outer membrane protein assembly factor BamE (lipoprotein component of BamABCDE complex)